ncbi:MAG TPA: L-fucose:H+ symporter permease, partial [Terriglobales bacterium]|nr:L-fucose:H+ symporter permease [Terriglobales bacterium]
MTISTPITERRYVRPLILVTTLFFLWALGVNLNDILIPHLKKVFNLTDFRSSLIQTAFFGGYFLSAVPAGRLMEKVGYRKGIIVGLLTCATGALLFIPAASVRVYGFFLFALFVMACGQGVLEVAANPYVTLLGPAESSERRLNLAQSFNSVGAVVTPFIGAAFILSSLEYSPAQLAAMGAVQIESYRTAVINTVKLPYLVIAAIFLAVAALIYFAHLPEIGEQNGNHEKESTASELKGILRYGHLVKGVLAQFFYVGAQVGVASFIIRFAQHISPELPQKSAAFYLKVHLIGFMIGRFSGSYVMKRIAAPRLLSLFAFCTLICLALVLSGTGAAALWAIALIGFFHSIMFPTIFALSIKRLGSFTKLGSSLLVASIIGGAVLPAIMGFISDHSSIRQAFFVPVVCQ